MVQEQIRCGILAEDRGKEVKRSRRKGVDDGGDKSKVFHSFNNERGGAEDKGGEPVCKE